MFVSLGGSVRWPGIPSFRIDDDEVFGLFGLGIDTDRGCAATVVIRRTGDQHGDNAVSSVAARAA